MARRRDHGGLVFVDLRDSTGVGQLVVNPERSPEAAKAAHDIRNEFVLRATGEVTARSPENVNPNIPTGEVELQVDELEVISTSPPLPFQLDEENVDETLRIRYRWLDLRRDKLQRNIRLRAQMVSIIRRVMEGAGFLDIETPILFKPTPEGARDFLVPSRLQKGKFFALPQSPQILKQLLVIAGFERYYQIARCFRDEDLRADRFNELTQLDVEMAFPDVEFIMALMEEMVQAIWRETIEVELEIPFARLTYADAMLRYGTDKPDLRFGLEIEDATELTRGSQFKVFADAPAVRYLTVPQEYSRADLERLEEFAKEWGAKGLAYIVYGEDGEARSPIAKFLSEDELAAFRAEPGSTVLFGADEPDQVARVLGALRSRLGHELGLVDEEAFRWVWVTDFPMFHWSRRSNGWAAAHHPFTRPAPGSEPMLEKDPGRALAVAYDLIANGEELGGGSLRIHESELQETSLRHPAHLARGAEGSLRLPARRAEHGRAAPRRHRLRHRPAGDGACPRAEPEGHGRVPEEPGRVRSDERRSERGHDRPARRARDAAEAGDETDRRGLVFRRCRRQLGRDSCSKRGFSSCSPSSSGSPTSIRC